MLKSPREMLIGLRQDAKETLIECHTKAHVSTLWSVVIEMTVSQFLVGLNDDQLMSRATERAAASVDDLDGN
ncbi:hypothetical protein GcM3_061021 [Golovinomyces cichoracearum]|uniref:Uncharacterized protein n=1 Tax=Golovinomyces cichoracearum TaxID=62708 RepID=A0A420IW22_9PEZI|nr:hypothetical protein GcM3_061021 [Golovinomyces cichoracearum]